MKSDTYNAIAVFFADIGYYIIIQMLLLEFMEGNDTKILVQFYTQPPNVKYSSVYLQI